MHLQVRCYWGDNEHRWMMWYNGSAECPEDKELPRTSIGEQLLAVLGYCKCHGGLLRRHPTGQSRNANHSFCHKNFAGIWYQFLGPAFCCAGLATSSDGVRWHRESSQPSDQPSVSQASGEAGKVLGPNADWWWHDTRHVSVSDVQVATVRLCHCCEEAILES